jgi:hypothetical protein
MDLARKLSASFLILLVLLLNSEQAAADIFIDLRYPSGNDGSSLEFTQHNGLIIDLIQPGSEFAQKVPVTNIRPLPFQWKLVNIENDLLPCPPVRTFPEFLQDIWRCPTVAFVLFPYHEFL